MLLLTARDAVEERVAGLEAGADDYLVKPFAVEELAARLRALLRRGTRAGGGPDASTTCASRPPRARATRAGRDLAPDAARGRRLLEVLLRHPPVGRRRARPLEAVWPGGAPTSNAVDRYVAYLREKLGPPPLIETVRGSGFALGRR